MDVKNGDANVVCLGPQSIDPLAKGGIAIEFDVAKLIQNKPTAFYKQLDFGYQLDKKHEVKLGKRSILFKYTDNSGIRCAEPSNTYFRLYNDKEYYFEIGELPKAKLISYNLEQMHEILTLNFFKFIDSFVDGVGVSSKDRVKDFVNSFYQEVDALTDKELLVFLTDIEKNMTDTMEFNFYGAHKIDFSTIINITARYKDYTLNIPEFINKLKEDCIDTLCEARLKIPEIFQSYRFIEYLLSKSPGQKIRYYLHDLRKQCKTPKWVEYTPLSSLKEFKLCWDVRKSETCGHKPLVASTVKSTDEELSPAGLPGHTLTEVHHSTSSHPSVQNCHR